ncbi:atrial natriuretic peptide-converting enzyme-like [Phymastichus coffea]|uniref:atrial natriuretic peptide-converting enzyme-like n=1 Tax=Phymastichus coffea TaxID=108790 RepID=UPI00273C0D09|nr:atrial natriuretic peptide-converting enzyme-like [Phymastichus coffea]
MSGASLRAADTSPTRQPRQNRTYSLGLPARTSFFSESLLADGGLAPPPLPRRNSAAPAVVKPPIPKRSRYERPIPVCVAGSQAQEPSSKQPSRKPPQQQSNSEAGARRAWQQEIMGSAFADFEANEAAFATQQPALRDRDSAALDQASRDLGKSLQKVTSQAAKSSSPGRSRKHLQPTLRVNRLSRSGQQRSPSRRCQQLQQQPRSTEDEDDEDDEDLPISQSSNKFAEMQAASRRLERQLPELDHRFHETVLSRQETQGSSKRESSNTEKLEKLPKATQTNLPPPLSSICQSSIPNKPVNSRQDSNVSSDSFSQTSSPSYTSKTMEAPLLPHKHSSNGKVPGRALAPDPENPPGSPITKSMSTPASLQTIVRCPNGSNMSLHHRIMRRPSSHYVTRGRLRFRFAQVLVNVVALMAIAGGLAAYFKSYPETTIKVTNDEKIAETGNEVAVLSEPILLIAETKNPAPGICLPVIVDFCRYHKIPYNYTVFPNYMGNFQQRDAQHELELYDSVIDVRCYELAALFLCSVFVPKCGPKNGQAVRPCRNLCLETKRRCGFFLEVFNLGLPDYLECKMFPESPDPNLCVGHQEVIDAEKRAAKPVCPNGFQCDEKRCIPLDWRCDGHVDCEDHTDEIDCGECKDSERAGLVAISSKKSAGPSVKNLLAQASLHCGERRCMSANHICDGKFDCPWAQDERNCLRLSERNGDVGKGRLEVYHAERGKYIAACVKYWTRNTAKDICKVLGYKSTNTWNLLKSESNQTVVKPVQEMSAQWRLAPKSEGNLLQDLKECSNQRDYTTIDLVCTGYECGRRSQNNNAKARTRIIGGSQSSPGDWPFLAAILGGPEQIFYCAGVLIADQWVLTASHCVGNRSEVSGWTIQLGITRRNSHTYLGKKLRVKRVVPHPNYNLGAAHDNDVALFQLEHRVEFHEHLRPVCLPPANIDLKPATECTVIGWGKKEDTETSEYEPAVNEVKVPVLSREVCNSWLLHKELNVTDGMICAGYPEGGKDACQGDSGGPLLCQDENDKDRWIVGGIVSWGIKCAHPRLPGVYAYVPKYVPWILKEIEEHSTNDYG